MPRLHRISAAIPAFLALSALLAGLVLSACTRAADAPDGASADAPRDPAREARIYAAASMTDVVAEIARAFEPARGSKVVASYGASSTLAQQIRDGAPAGVFISANAEWADKLESWGLAEPGSRVELAGNALVVIVPAGAKLRPSSIEDLADAKFARIALGDPVAVPAGKYANAALEKAGVYEQIRARIVAAQDVRTALAYVERGEVDAGIVYATDAKASGKVETAFRVSAELHPRIVYPMLLVKRANRRARELHAFLRTPEVRAILERAGFTAP